MCIDQYVAGMQTRELRCGVGKGQKGGMFKGKWSFVRQDMFVWQEPREKGRNEEGCSQVRRLQVRRSCEIKLLQSTSLCSQHEPRRLAFLIETKTLLLLACEATSILLVLSSRTRLCHKLPLHESVHSYLMPQVDFKLLRVMSRP